MKNSNIKKFYNFLDSQEAETTNDIAWMILDAYKMYSDMFVNTYNDLINSPKKFSTLINDYVSSLDKEYHKFYKYTILSLKNNLVQALECRLNVIHFQFNAEFSYILQTVMPSKKVKLADIGSGEVPLLSIFTDTVKPIDAIDKEVFYLGEKYLKRNGVNPISQEFSNTSSISDYDMLVGQKPCNALIPAIENCSKHNKPYIFSLCQCAFNDTEISNLDTFNQALAHEYLKSIDPNIQYYEDYVYNLDTTPKQIENIINNFIETKLYEVLSTFEDDSSFEK